MSASSIARAAMLLVASILSAPVVTTAVAQDSSSCGCIIIRKQGEPNAFERHSSGTLSFIQSRPQGVLGQNIGLGYGIDGAYLFRLDHAGAFALRADA
jgi:hypothetical protein